MQEKGKVRESAREGESLRKRRESEREREEKVQKKDEEMGE